MVVELDENPWRKHIPYDENGKQFEAKIENGLQDMVCKQLMEKMLHLFMSL